MAFVRQIRRRGLRGWNADGTYTATVDPNAGSQPFDDLFAANNDFNSLPTAGAPTGGGSLSTLFSSVTSNPAYQGSLSSSSSWVPLAIGAAAFLVLLAALKGGR